MLAQELALLEKDVYLKREKESRGVTNVTSFSLCLSLVS